MLLPGAVPRLVSTSARMKKKWEQAAGRVRGVKGGGKEYKTLADQPTPASVTPSSATFHILLDKKLESAGTQGC